MKPCSSTCGNPGDPTHHWLHIMRSICWNTNTGASSSKSGRSRGQHRAVSDRSARFLSYHLASGKVPLRKLQAQDVVDFVLHDTSNRGHRSAQLMTRCCAASGFLFQHGRIATNLGAAVPAMADGASRPASLFGSKQVEKILHSCDGGGSGQTGLRHLATLGPFGTSRSEVANLTLDDINWRAGELRIQGKGARSTSCRS